MKTLTNLKSDCIESDFKEAQVHHAVYGEEPKKGFSRSYRVGPEAIRFVQGKESVVIPMNELWKLVESVNPAFIPKDTSELPVENNQTSN
jgi:hypothetical protein